MLQISDRLTNSEIEQLRRNRIELHEFCQKLFSEPKPDQDTPAKPYDLTSEDETRKD